MAKDMIITRAFDAPTEDLWKAWSEAAYLKQWWGPHGFTAPVAEMDFREGGTSLVCMSSPEHGDFYNTWTYTKIIPKKRIEYVVRFSDKDSNRLTPVEAGVHPELHDEVPHTIIFKDLGNGTTEVTVTESGYTSEEVLAISKAGMEQCLDKMAAIFTAKKE